MKRFKVTFLPSNRKGEVSEGTTVLQAARELGEGIESLCGGLRNCGKCKVTLLQGNLSPFTDEEAKFITGDERREDYRLACVAQIQGDVSIFVPEESQALEQTIRKNSKQKAFPVKPAIIPYFVELPPPTLIDSLGDLDRLRHGLSGQYGLNNLDIDYPALKKLPHALRQGDWKVTVAVWMGQEIMDVQPGPIGDLYGLAIDVGTTTVAGYLCNLNNGEIVSVQSMMNPQIMYGEDIMSRISYSIAHPDGLKKLHLSIIEGLNQLMRAIVGQSNLSTENILEMTVVGNTVMHHLFLGIDPRYLGASPFPPVLNRSMDIKARELGLKAHPSANVHLLPIEAGFVGADNVGVLVAEEPHHKDENVLVIDVGTNGELVLGNGNQLLSASCATGPAFEGAQIRFGMRAAPGAIERVKIDANTLEVDFKVIGEENWKSKAGRTRAKGICGSGIIDAVAELYRNGVIDKSGRFTKDLLSRRLITSDGRPEYVVAWKHETSIGKEITVTQQDVRNVQLAKGALYAGVRLLMKKMGVKKLDRVILAGAFGSYIDPEEAMILGMFPDCDLKNVCAVGNAAGEGARMALLNRDKRLEADEIARKVNYVELTLEADFQKEFIEAMQFPRMHVPFPHLNRLIRDSSPP